MTESRSLPVVLTGLTAPPPSCEHLHEQTSRYDRVEKKLTFLLVCPVCRTERVMEEQRYEPRLEPLRVSGASGATLHRLPAGDKWTAPLAA